MLQYIVLKYMSSAALCMDQIQACSLLSFSLSLPPSLPFTYLGVIISQSVFSENSSPLLPSFVTFKEVYSRQEKSGTALQFPSNLFTYIKSFQAKAFLKVL